MERDWSDFKSLYGNLPGARDAFEKACETLFRNVYSKENVQQVSIKKGDGGIDIFIGNYGVEPLTVIQCKFFLDEIKSSQQSQIRSSFIKSKESGDYELNEWVLCVPRVLNSDEHKWWAQWKGKMEETYGLNDNFIKLKNGNEIIDLMKGVGVYNSVFQIIDSILIEDTNFAVKEILTLLQEQNASSEIKAKKGLSDRQLINKILFNNYSLDKEEFYIERNEDKSFKSLIEIINVWVYGKSGSGKTALIQRNLLIQKTDFIYCDFSPVSVFSVDDILVEILVEIEQRYNVQGVEYKSNLIKKIFSVLKTNCVNEEIVIVIDELSIPNPEIQKDFTDKIIRLINYCNNNHQQNFLKFVISTINEPATSPLNRSKASEYFDFLPTNNWDDKIGSLIIHISKQLNLDLEPNHLLLIEKGCNGSPRLAKNIFRKIVLLEEISDISVKEAISFALKEHF